MRQPAVNVTVLMEKLIAIEQAIGAETNVTVRRMTQDAQDCLLDLQREWLESPFKFRVDQEYSGRIN